MTGPLVCSNRVAASVPGLRQHRVQRVDGRAPGRDAGRGRRRPWRRGARGRRAGSCGRRGRSPAARPAPRSAARARPWHDPPRQLADHPDQAGDLRAEHPVGDLALAVVHELRVVDEPAGELGVQRGQRRLAGGVDQHLVDLGERVVARRPGRPPGLRQVLARLEDLLDDRPPVARRLGQPVEVALRVGQAVGVVDPQPVDRALVHQLQDQRVGRVEDRRVLDPQAGEGVDREEPAVVEVGVRAPPVDQLVVLAGVHLLRRPAPGARRDREAVVVVVQLGCPSPPPRRRPRAPRRRPPSRAPGCGPCRRRTPSRCRTPRRGRCPGRAAARPTTTARPRRRRRPCGWAPGRAPGRARAGAAPRRTGRSRPARRAPRRCARGRPCRTRGCCPRPSAAGERSRRASPRGRPGSRPPRRRPPGGTRRGPAAGRWPPAPPGGARRRGR